MEVHYAAVPYWFYKRRGFYLGLLSFFGQLGLAVWYLGEAFAESRTPYLFMGLFGLTGIVLLLYGGLLNRWALLKYGAVVGLWSWILIGAQILFPDFFDFISIPNYTEIAFILVGGCAAFQTFFLWRVAKIEIHLRRRRE